MRNNGWCLLWLLPLPVLAADRDPFEPVEDHCQTAQLAQWHYGGAVGTAQQNVGYLQDRTGKWRRVRVDDALPPGWQVTALTAERIEITTGPGCEPLHWAWKRKENGINDAMDKPADSAAASTGGYRTRSGKK